MIKKKRQEIYEKYGGHCAYCGKKIEYEDEMLCCRKSLPFVEVARKWRKEVGI